MAEASADISVIQTMAPTPTAVGEAPWLVHGESAEKPSPLPRASRISDSAAAATAPPSIAPHDTALVVCADDDPATVTTRASCPRLATVISICVPLMGDCARDVR